MTISDSASGWVECVPFQSSATTYVYEGASTFELDNLAALLDRGLPAKCYPPIAPKSFAPAVNVQGWRQQFRGHKFKIGGSKK